jgi:hypothetical protein
MAMAEVPATNNGKVERPATEIGAAMLPGHKVSKGKKKANSGRESIALTFFSVLSCSLLCLERCVLDNARRNRD